MNNTRRLSSTDARSRIFVVDDHPIVRQGLAALIDREPDLTVCGEAEDASSALQGIHTLNPDLVIVDISLNGPTGCQRREGPNLRRGRR